jgi:hypothetical protein
LFSSWILGLLIRWRSEMSLWTLVSRSLGSLSREISFLMLNSAGELTMGIFLLAHGTFGDVFHCPFEQN